jgi:outer membrane protein W
MWKEKRKIMKVLKTLAIVGSIALLASTAVAQTEKGKWDVSLLGSYNCGWIGGSVNSGTLQVYQGGLGLGYFITKPLEIKLNGSVLGASAGDSGSFGGSFTVIPVTIGADYHFDIERLLPYTQGKTVPYLGAGLGGAIFTGNAGALGKSESATMGALMVDGHVGLKQFVSKDVSLNLQVGYQYLPLPGISLNNVTVGVGLSFYF